MNPRRLLVSMLGLCLALAGPAHAATDVLVLTGVAAPDGNGTLSSIGSPALTSAGSVSFSAGLAGTVGSTNDNSGLFAWSPIAGLQQLAREGQATPGGNGTFGNIGSGFAANDVGQVAFDNLARNTTGGTADAEGLYLADTTGVTRLANRGDLAPTQGTLYSFQGLALNDAGQVAFNGRISRFDGDIRIHISEANTPTALVGRKGLGAPFILSANFYSFGNPDINDAGRVAYNFDVLGTTANPHPEGYVLTRDGSDPFKNPFFEVARENEPAPDGDGTFSSVLRPQINSSEQVAFLGSLTGGAGLTNGGSGVYRRDGNAPVIELLRGGRPAPDGNGNLADHGSIGFAFNDLGQIATAAVFTDSAGGTTDDQGVVLADGSTTALIAREGSPTPDGSATYGHFFNPVLNDAGQAAFADFDPDTFLTQGLYQYDPAAGVSEVARLGDPLLGSTISALSSLSNTNTNATALNELGQFAFAFTLADDRAGIALWSPASTGLAGDYNGSGQVEQGDLDLVLQNWGRNTNTQGIPTGWLNDLPGGQIEQTELDGILQNWGSTSAPDFSGSTVPEPGSFVLLSVSAGAVTTRRRNRGPLPHPV